MPKKEKGGCQNSTIDRILAFFAIALLITILIVLVILYVRVVRPTGIFRKHHETRSAFYTGTSIPTTTTHTPTVGTQRPSSSVLQPPPQLKPVTSLGSGSEDTTIVTQTQGLPTQVDAVRVDGILDVSILRGTASSVRTDVPTFLVPFFKVEVGTGNSDKNILYVILDLKDRSVNFPDGKSIHVTVVLPSLSSLETSGISTTTVSGFDPDDKDLTIVSSGISTIHMSGSSRVITIRQSGVGKLDASGWKAKDVRIDVSGTGDASVHADNSIDVRVSGIGTVTVYGNPPTRNIQQASPFMQNVVFV